MSAGSRAGRRRGAPAAAVLVLLLFGGPGSRGSVSAAVLGAIPPRPGVRLSSLVSARLVVDPAGPLRRLGDALRRARAGDTIVVRPGVYREPTVVVDRRVVILGEPGAVLDGEGMRQIMLVRADDVVVRGLTFRRVDASFVEDRAAIRTDSVRGCVIEGNRIENAFYGIYLANTAGCRVRRNTVLGNTSPEMMLGNGVYLWHARGVDVVGNRVSGYRDGIYLEHVVHGRLRDNISERNLRYGLHFMFSDSCDFRQNVLRRNGVGVAVMYTRHFSGEANRIERHAESASYGILLEGVSDGRIVGNTIADNTVGMYAGDAHRVRVIGNRLVHNGWAVRIIVNCSYDSFTGNDFLGNTFDVATSSSGDHSRFARNYWDHYRGYDLRGDGTGDVPYHPVRLFSLITERTPPAVVLLHSLFVAVLDAAEQAFPALTPAALTDSTPRMRPVVENAP